MYDNTSLWPAPTSMQRNVRVCSSFVRFEKVANDATNLKTRSARLVQKSYRNDGWMGRWMTRKWKMHGRWTYGGWALAASLTARFISSL
jgi:hypothetical protein